MRHRLQGAVRAAFVLHAMGKILNRLVRATVAIALVCGSAMPAMAQSESETGAAPFSISTLETVRARGYVVCAAARPLPGFAQISADSLWSGFDVDLCRAV